ncbi:CGNR zinc finger domain-containing protein [Brevibacterium aurantiacum]|uniref:CGNR zinc finger domain-containing protein n=1 Tax=Brevibacterium aurantiacum TaxID=273384 RepID=UPI000F64CA79|nr:CGNR zinc finger domain-containing protein [Brevibacterium aurantiacum]AZL10474.1 hypothetical protein CXR26_15535 [Brevibacterium aurantiacum]
MVPRYPEFRPGDILATTFTGTLSERQGEPVERLPSPERLVDWLIWQHLMVSFCSETELADAKRLRESIHLVATAAATEEPFPQQPLDTLNEFSAEGQAVAVLTSGAELEWRLKSVSVRDALRVIATDAISVISGNRDGKLTVCASPTCRAAFLDTSRGRTRRWCDMNTCGNREKKARFRARNA